LKYKWYRVEGKLTRPWINSTIDFGFWIGAKDEKQARARVEKNYKGKKYSFALETIIEDPVGPPGNEK
tara:strand:+ start:1489 stop:1692 length:204 start_codon:yes stop_codon:yes gene_type:complete